MPDFATSTDPAVQRQLDRLSLLGPGADILGLDRITRLLDRVGNPHRHLPPVFHVAGTNGKGSTCAYLRAGLEAAGHRVHVYTSPHLVRFNERIRVAGQLIGDAALAPLLAEVLDAGSDIGASFFEVTTAVAFLAFARTPADACVIEVGLGGRLDATNVIDHPAVCGIAQLGLDHQAFLGDTIEAIAAEKAGIAKPGVPLVTFDYPPAIRDVVAAAAHTRRAPVLRAGADWHWDITDGRLAYRDGGGERTLDLPTLAGSHQAANCALATAMLRHQRALQIPDAAIAAMPSGARWPARMQRLSDGPLTRRLPAGSTLWLDGGHNPAAAQAVRDALAGVAESRPIAIVLGMLANKDPDGLLAPFAAMTDRLVAVPVPGHAHHVPEALATLGKALGIGVTDTAADVPDALDAIASATRSPVTVLVLGSLYLAGRVLAANEELPD
ncbi:MULTISPECIES: bifunctional folylpolyglutamate synthase/dihydrofolate synthase [unclassified Sphingomonas]|uniref:bifunctional folylpolyglutamate synthase/dihydrofolate synthase n=1 Tax=unclassified Sphingomonas TaxID=196159 RepID=UPI000834DA25|nr:MULTISPECIES: folylpolyglutamate synthase/dihydrofolate synthase family protein [unclassified Sphingomonas]